MERIDSGERVVPDAGPDNIENAPHQIVTRVNPQQEGAGEAIPASIRPGGRPEETFTFTLPGEPHPDGAATRVHLALDLPPGGRVQVTVEALPGATPENPAPVRVTLETQATAASLVNVAQAPGMPRGMAHLRTRLRSWPYSLAATLFGLSLAVYLITHLIGLTRFPIYFFTDEAIQTIAAADLVRDGFRDEEGTFLPTYFKNGSFYNLSTSVYLQLLPYLLFGKSVFVTRATAVLVSLLAAGSLGLMLRDIFKLPYWWSGVLLLGIAPAWFLHSRTAFETVIFVSFYAAFLYAYLLYRYRDPRNLYLAILLGALGFYAYSPGQLVIGLTALLLLLSDARFHWQNRAVVLRGLGLLTLLALPYLRFRLGHPEAPFDHLRRLGSYWLQPLSLEEKLSRYFSEYLYGLSPGYWFMPNERDLPRHLMKGYGNLLRASLPFAVLGFVLALKRIRSSAYRLLIIALLVAPAGSALVQIGITRALVFVIPATVLIALGLSWFLVWLEGRKLPAPALSVGLFALLAVVNFGMLRDALVNGPTWYSDYGLGGMQYGARQLFPEIEAYLERSPDTRSILSPAWANGTDVVARFFLPDPLPIQLGSIEGHLFEHLPLDENMLFIMIPEEYEKARASGKFSDIRVEQTLKYPDGRDGFYFARLSYVEGIDAILAEERAARRALQSTEIILDGQLVQVKYPLLDIGAARDMFDQDPDTLGRTLEANPAVIELTFPRPRQIGGLSIIVGSTEAEITTRLYRSPGATPVEFTQRLQGSVDQPEVTLEFDEIVSAQILRLEVRDVQQGEPGHIHIWEIELH